ncbi:MAG: hypothetical protein ACREJ6_08760 [Candidatus Methylomirabilis sp.]
MRSRRFRNMGVALLLVMGISLSGCSLWNKVWFSQGEGEQKAEKGKAAASSNNPKKEPAPAAAPPVPGAAAKTDNPVAKEKDKPVEKPLTESQKEWEEKIARSPFLVSGEYFRQREPGGAFNLDFGRLFGQSKEEEQRRKSMEERLAKLEAELAAGAASGAAPAAGTPRARVVVADGRGPMNRVALVALEPETANPKAFGRIPLEIVASAIEKEPRLVVVESPLVDRVLQDQRVRPKVANAKQVATLLERDLGTQLVVFLDEADVSSDWDRRGQVQAQVILKGEVREGVTGQPLSLLSAKGTQTASGAQEALARVEALKQASDQLSAAILKKVLEYEWGARVLSVEDGRVRLNAGRRSGLQEGDLLRVFRSGGQEIYHPTTKLFVGIDLGDPKGKVRVTDFFGADAAIAKITEGSDFAPNDLLKLDKR